MDIGLLLIRIIGILLLTVVAMACFSNIGKTTRGSVWTRRKAIRGLVLFWSLYLLGFLSHG
ncbi:hypothetical protein NAV33_07495 [Pseudomonas stutzeri]|uniref:hypothetical protein n=1 Tax=Stutzerimonas stutzeri TaxID=316 RepID=UPI00210E4385|nr:hypothetical protein [Stutzerimonas stutzeri]MCQ4311739.1 hypothetical protein [Stutzerimonas stutzeri]